MMLKVAIVLLALAFAACGGAGGEGPEITGIDAKSPVEPNTQTRVTAQASTGSVCLVMVGAIIRTDGQDPPRSVAPKSPDSNGEVSWRVGVPLEAIEQDVTFRVECERNGQTVARETSIHIGPRLRPVPTETPTPSP